MYVGFNRQWMTVSGLRELPLWKAHNYMQTNSSWSYNPFVSITNRDSINDLPVTYSPRNNMMESAIHNPRDQNVLVVSSTSHIISVALLNIRIPAEFWSFPRDPVRLLFK